RRLTGPWPQLLYLAAIGAAGWNRDLALLPLPRGTGRHRGVAAVLDSRHGKSRAGVLHMERPRPALADYPGFGAAGPPMEGERVAGPAWSESPPPPRGRGLMWRTRGPGVSRPCRPAARRPRWLGPAAGRVRRRGWPGGRGPAPRSRRAGREPGGRRCPRRGRHGRLPW